MQMEHRRLGRASWGTAPGQVSQRGQCALAGGQPEPRPKRGSHRGGSWEHGVRPRQRESRGQDSTCAASHVKVTFLRASPTTCPGGCCSCGLAGPGPQNLPGLTFASKEHCPSTVRATQEATESKALLCRWAMSLDVC